MPAPAGKLTEAPVVLVTLEHAGRIWRLASSTVDVVDRFGVTHHYEGRISDSDVYEEAVPFSFEVGGAIPIEFVPPDSFAALQDEGASPSSVSGSVAQWSRGTRLEEAVERVRGVVDVLSWGARGEAARVSIAPQDPADDQSTYPPENQTINDTTWYTPGGIRSYDEDAVGGRAYPTVFGKNGLMRKRAGFTTVAASPAYKVFAANSALVHTTPFHNAQGNQIIINRPGGPGNPVAPSWTVWWLIAGHWTYPKLQVGTADYRVTLHDSDGNSEWAYLYFAHDALGQVVALAGKNSFSSLNPSAAEFWVSFDDGALGNYRYDGPMLTAGELLRWILERSSKPVDWTRARGPLGQLSAYKLAGYWDQSVSPWAWAGDNLSPLLPVSIRSGPEGVFPAIWRIDATAADAKYHLVDGLDCHIEEEPKQLALEDLFSKVTLEYARSLRTGSVFGRKTFGGDRDTVNDSPSLHTRRADLFFAKQAPGSSTGKVPRVESTDLISGDDVTADLVASFLAQVYSGAWTDIHAISDGLHHRSYFLRLEPCEVVTITSARYGFDRRVAHVRKAGRAGSIAYVDLLLFPLP
jgi:hypothetical protein